MYKLYGKNVSADEIKEHVSNYVNRVKESNDDRFHDLMALIPECSGKKALDYGCGWGHFAVEMNEKKGYKVTGIDHSKNEISICKLVWGTKKNALYFSTKKIQDFQKHEFDLVFSSQVIEHVHNPGTYLSEINRVLKTGGYLVIGLPNVMNPRFFLNLMSPKLNTSLLKISNDIINNYDKTHDHIQSWDPTHFVRLVSTVGFLFEDYMPMEGVPFPHRWPFKPYINIKNKRIRNLSYTMGFRFKKIAEKKINPFD